MKNDSEKAPGYLAKSKVYKGFHYSVLSHEMYDYHHSTTFRMMKEIVSIFEKHQIKYTLVGGTLLGAVTLHDFIPWDDDVDIAVFEQDYEAAMQHLQAELSPQFVLQCNETEPNYYLGWAKVRDRASHVYPDAPLYKENGVWVDVYKLSLMRKKDYDFNVAKENFDYVIRRYKKGGLTKAELTSRIKKGHLKSAVFWAWVRRLFARQTGKIYMIRSASKIAIDAESVFPLQRIVFRDLEVNAIRDADGYLKEHYGESYGVFPPDSDRRVGINRIEFQKTL